MAESDSKSNNDVTLGYTARDTGAVWHPGIDPIAFSAGQYVRETYDRAFSVPAGESRPVSTGGAEAFGELLGGIALLLKTTVWVMLTAAWLIFLTLLAALTAIFFLIRGSSRRRLTRPERLVSVESAVFAGIHVGGWLHSLATKAAQAVLRRVRAT